MPIPTKQQMITVVRLLMEVRDGILIPSTLKILKALVY